MKATVSRIKINNVIFIRVDKGDKYFNVSHENVINYLKWMGFTELESQSLAITIMDRAYNEAINLEFFIMLANEFEEDDWSSDEDDNYDFVESLKQII
jgi:hypothetical protein